MLPTVTVTGGTSIGSEPTRTCQSGSPNSHAHQSAWTKRASKRRCQRRSVASVTMKDRQRARAEAGWPPLGRARQRRTTGLSPEDGEFVPKHDDFQFLELVRPK